jgi:hypothetical protein
MTTISLKAEGVPKEQYLLLLQFLEEHYRQIEVTLGKRDQAAGERKKGEELHALIQDEMEEVKTVKNTVFNFLFDVTFLDKAAYTKYMLHYGTLHQS